MLRITALNFKIPSSVEGVKCYSAFLSSVCWPKIFSLGPVAVHTLIWLSTRQIRSVIGNLILG